jgi:uncharacterized hydrophobic protein (TIGR00341 family)
VGQGHIQMKKVLINIRNEEYPRIEPLLEKQHFSRTYKENIMEIRLYLPDAELDKFISDIQNVMDLRYKDNLIEVSTPQFVISPYLKREEDKVEKPKKPPIEELIATTEKYIAFEWGSVAITTIAGLVALTGLFLNNSAIIIGAMLLSPILGPMSAFAILIAVGRTRNALQSLGILGLLLGAVILFSAFTTFVIHTFYIDLPLTPEILTRTEVSPIYIGMAILLGVATIVAISRNISEIIAGVAVAAALIPPTVVVGILLILNPGEAYHSLILVLENVIGLLAGTVAATLILRIAPRTRGERTMARRIAVRAAVVFAMLIIILFILSLLIA